MTNGTLPNALFAGPMKAGTSWIHAYLAARGDVCLPRQVKETFFFDKYFSRGTDWYAKRFVDYDPVRHRLVAEVAPSYFHCPEAPERVRRCLGNVPVAFTLRHPVERAFSHYLHRYRYGVTRKAIRSAIDDLPEIVEASRYATVLRRWMRCFPRTDLHILLLEELAASPNEFAASVCGPLSLPYMPPGDLGRLDKNAAAMPPSFFLARAGKRLGNALRFLGFYGVVDTAKRLGLKRVFFGGAGRGALPRLSSGDAEFLRSLLLDEILALEEMMQIDLSAWKAPRSGQSGARHEGLIESLHRRSQQ
jgi:hypothetical protein